MAKFVDNYGVYSAPPNGNAENATLQRMAVLNAPGIRCDNDLKLKDGSWPGIARQVCVMMLLCWAFSTTSLAQNKRVAEECTQNADCETGKCVQLKSEDKKVCLYCGEGDYENYFSGVKNKCKDVDGPESHGDLRDELRKSEDKKGEFSLVWLKNRRELAVGCLDARLTREQECWKDKMDSGHKEQIDKLKEAIRLNDDLVSDGIRNGRAYRVDPEHFDHLMEDEEEHCKELHKDFEWLSNLKEDEKANCTEISSVADRAHDCREVRKSIVDVFEEHASQYRTDALKEAEAAESEAKKMLEHKHSKNLCE